MTRPARDVRSLFELIAPRYDRFTRWFSYGMDRLWKRDLLRQLFKRLPRDGRIVDLACGTGDLGIAAARGIVGSRVLGIDIAARMLSLAARKRDVSYLPVQLARGDMRAIPAADGSADAVLAGYGVRNAGEAAVAVAQVARVLRRGGWFLVLDFYQPRHPVWRRLFLGYLSAMGTVYGLLWHRAPSAYTYIAQSIQAHMTAEAFSGLLERSGFEVEVEELRLGGGIGLHVGRKR
jgi:demethylmenaquinone methyltransferase/2-methoxy-6-polyprenyl-1,4-benzoquinol methylase